MKAVGGGWWSEVVQQFLKAAICVVENTLLSQQYTAIKMLIDAGGYAVKYCSYFFDLLINFEWP